MNRVHEQHNTLLACLADGPRTSAELRRDLNDISPPTLSRLVERLSGKVVILGKARAAIYARPRDIRGCGHRFPVYRIDEMGNARQHGVLHAVLGRHFWWEALDAGHSKLYSYLPWFIQDMRPDGFMGRAFVQKVSRDLNLPVRLPDWKDEDVLVALSRRGDDCMGDLIVGDESMERYLNTTRDQSKPVHSVDDYPLLARQAIEGDSAGSSAGGEQPKFTTIIEQDGELRHVLVKFSTDIATQEGRRWADLLVCEHLALEIIREAGLPAAHSRLHMTKGRVFLEVIRFDRIGRFGRAPINSLGVVDDEFFGRRDNWTAMAKRLLSARMVSAEDAAAIRWFSAFGTLIANTDQHFGNISLIPENTPQPRFRLAPAYDMLPMLYRPRNSEAPLPEFNPPVPVLPTNFEEVLRHSLLFWNRAALDGRISDEFRTVCAQNAEKVKELEEGPRLMTQDIC
jgi:hypothetical protein